MPCVFETLPQRVFFGLIARLASPTTNSSMRYLTLCLASMQLFGVLTAYAQKIVRHDLRFDRLMPSDAVAEKLDDGHVWVEIGNDGARAP
jgi:hypothetical protein